MLVQLIMNSVVKCNTYKFTQPEEEELTYQQVDTNIPRVENFHPPKGILKK